MRVQHMHGELQKTRGWVHALVCDMYAGWHSAAADAGRVTPAAGNMRLGACTGVWRGTYVGWHAGEAGAGGVTEMSRVLLGCQWHIHMRACF
jgi:hypothetical protein